MFSSFVPNDYLNYTIRFENTGNTRAEKAKIINLLHAKIEETSIIIVGSSVKCQLIRVVNNFTFSFDEINLPSSAANTHICHGFVNYKAKLKPGFSVGTIVPNSA